MNKEIILKALQIGLDNTNEMYADMIVCEHNPIKKKHLTQLWDNERQYIMLAIEQVESIKG